MRRVGGGDGGPGGVFPAPAASVTAALPAAALPALSPTYQEHPQ